MHILLLLWLSPETSVAYATWGLFAVTFLLTVVTGLLVRDGSDKSREQRERWEFEDARWESDRQPSAIVEITADAELPTKMGFTCFNLGSTTFYIDELIVTASNGSRYISDIEPKIVMPGTRITITYNPCEVLGVHPRDAQFVEANCVLVLRGATGIARTEPVWFYVGDRPLNSSHCQWYVGRLANRQEGAIVRRPKIIGFPDPDHT